jgi:deoxyribodipyrimidine photo-lyase
MLKIVIGKDYSAPIVDHALQREKALSLYKAASKSNSNSI